MADVVAVIRWLAGPKCGEDQASALSLVGAFFHDSAARVASFPAEQRYMRANQCPCRFGGQPHTCCGVIMRVEAVVGHGSARLKAGHRNVCRYQEVVR